MKGNTKSPNQSIQKLWVKTIFFLVSISVMFSAGCSRYQYVTIDSYLYKNANNEFVEEDDTVCVTYSFSGEDFPIKLTVFNKLRQPLYFDVKKSEVIMNDIFIKDAFESGGQFYTIGPQSSSIITSNNLSDKFISLSSQDSMYKVLIATTQGPHKVKQHIYNENTSPVFFSSVLAFSTKPNLSDSFFYEHPFWVSGIYETLDVVPNAIPSNQFSMKKATDFAMFMTYTGAIVLMVAILALSPTTLEEEE
jgi:hypothetical protein